MINVLIGRPFPLDNKKKILALDEADTLIVQVYYKLKQSSDEKLAAMKLFEASVNIQEAIEIIERLD